MKKLYAFLILGLTITIGNAQIINFPDANFKAKLLSSSPTNFIAKSISGAYIKIDANNDGEIDVNEANQISWLEVSNQNGPASVLISNLDGIENFINLKRLQISYNNISVIDLSSFPLLEAFFCQVNQITSLDFTGLTHVTGITAFQNQLTNFNVNGLVNLVTVYCKSNNLLTLDFNSCTSLNNLSCGNNQLVSLFVKNGRSEGLGFGSNPNLTYICADEVQLNNVQNLLDIFGNTNCNINTYCSFVPGGNYSTVQGNSKIDSDLNGCDPVDLTCAFMKFDAVNGSVTSSFFSDSTGNYSISLPQGTYTITPRLENPSYFNVSPSSIPITVPLASNLLQQNFCLTPNGLHRDLESWIVPLSPARPGFDSLYKIVYRNKGNQTISDNLSFAFNDDYMDFVSATPAPDNQSQSLLSWNYVNLRPFERREIFVTLNLNSPQESLPLHAGDIIKFECTIFPLASDEYLTDNSNYLRQVLVASMDPNDKNCLEGNVVGTEKIGEFVHYMIRFENTGTFAAENVVVKDIIDSAKFDVSTLVPLSSSHSFVTKISNTNRVEFVFENINLPFDDANNDGYVVFKIKTKPTLVVGNTFTNTANIYFDYNFPIVTNTATTLIQLLGTSDFDFGSRFTLSPVPAKNLLTITNKQNSVISSISIYNTLGQLIQVSTNPDETIDVSGLKTGSYFIKIITDKGTASSKFVKE